MKQWRRERSPQAAILEALAAAVEGKVLARHRGLRSTPARPAGDPRRARS